jgi:hypothetical protein
VDAQIRFQNRNNKREDGNKTIMDSFGNRDVTKSSKVRLSAWNNLFKE